MRLVIVIAGIAIVVGGCCNNGSRNQAQKEYTAHPPIVVFPLSVSEDATTDHIRIGREVKNPGYYRWVNGMTLTDAISSADEAFQYSLAVLQYMCSIKTVRSRVFTIMMLST